jgi:hypothetical protein
MLTICTRCRTPYDRRLADAYAPAHLVALCADCAGGTVREGGATLMTLPAPHAEVTVLPRSVLPIAS